MPPRRKTVVGAGGSAVTRAGTPARRDQASPLTTTSNAAAANRDAMSLPTYTTGEKVLCYHGPLLYEAKVLKTAPIEQDASTATTEGGTQYFVHYKGWKQTYVAIYLFL